MKEMIKRRKDEGFTLIELMIVIAVIGILAIVLVPKVGTIKTQAKGAGIETNVRMVQGYLQSKASKWVDQGVNQATVASDVYNAFNNVDNNEKIKNPFTQSTTISNLANGTNDDNALQITKGTVANPGGKGNTVVVIPTSINGTVEFTVYGYDNAGKIASTVKVTP